MFYSWDYNESQRKCNIKSTQTLPTAIQTNKKLNKFRPGAYQETFYKVKQNIKFKIKKKNPPKK